MAPLPRPPFLPQSLQEFAEHVVNHQSEWYEYCRDAYKFIEENDTALAEALENTHQAELKLEALQLEYNRLKETHARVQGVTEMH
ncbi:hypothetical protein CNMCM6106_000651 [Aspergillus hiratsukae]|uniref:Uncharacterized protein n=1 Tax=Aspergillus hiratsukae TaxID=1194566 RepID=A0A8H6QKG7_9EURO|nr:hypothetical protein CNMCM6106_000651 [Aspergillus hiratsukae]